MPSQANAPAPIYMMPAVPILQPPNIPGDPAFATEILPGPPPLLSSQPPPQGPQKREPRKATLGVSYLPPSDPGSSYSGHGGSFTTPADVQDTARKVPKGSTGRAQRASARNLPGAVDMNEQPVASTSSDHTFIHENPLPPLDQTEESSTSRSASVPVIIVPPAILPVKRGRPKGSTKKKKELELEAALAAATSADVFTVKEEPKNTLMPSYITPEPISALQLNEDHCSSCQSLGSLVYCDGCPRAFHLWCLDPPIENEDLPDGWFCPACTVRKNPPPALLETFMNPLVHQVQISFPTEFRLPDDIRTFFKDVASGPRGAYVDNAEIKHPRLNRLGQLEDRDPHRLKDKNGAAVLCFKCGTSSLPVNLTATASSSSTTSSTKRARKASAKAQAASTDPWKSMVSCDYCSLHWHLDCVNPPISTMPTFGKKWMCPNHAEKSHLPKRRVPKQNAAPIEITEPNQPNNGNIDIVQPQTATESQRKAVAMAMDEVQINGRRYRVPERIIVLDFWNKVSKAPVVDDDDCDSAMSSPLTSISELEDPDEELVLNTAPVKHSDDDINLAQLLFNLRGPAAEVDAPFATGSVFVPAVAGPNTTVSTPPNGKSKRVKKPSKKASGEDGYSASAGPSKPRRKPPTKPPPATTEPRETRSRTKDVPGGSARSDSLQPVFPTPQEEGVTTISSIWTNGKKVDTVINGQSIKILTAEAGPPSLSARAKPTTNGPGRKRASTVPDIVDLADSTPVVTIPPRGTKRKERDGDDGSFEVKHKKERAVKERLIEEKGKERETHENKGKDAVLGPVNGKEGEDMRPPASPGKQTTTAAIPPITPKLKIRLPGMVSVHKAQPTATTTTTSGGRDPPSVPPPIVTAVATNDLPVLS